MNFLRRLALQEKKLVDSALLDVVETARVPDASELVSFLVGLRTYKHPGKLFICQPLFNPLTPYDHYSGRTAPLTSKRCILYIYSTNRGTEYFKHGMYSPFFFFSSKCSLFHNSKVFGSYFIRILFTGCGKI